MTFVSFHTLGVLTRRAKGKQDTHHAQHLDHRRESRQRVHHNLHNSMAISIVTNMNQRHDSIKYVSGLERLARSNLLVARELIISVQIIEVTTQTLNSKAL
jgi:hypothetical protein